MTFLRSISVTRTDLTWLDPRLRVSLRACVYAVIIILNFLLHCHEQSKGKKGVYLLDKLGCNVSLELDAMQEFARISKPEYEHALP